MYFLETEYFSGEKFLRAHLYMGSAMFQKIHVFDEFLNLYQFQIFVV